jgi:hypothetical protein
VSQSDGGEGEDLCDERHEGVEQSEGGVPDIDQHLAGHTVLLRANHAGFAHLGGH